MTIGQAMGSAAGDKTHDSGRYMEEEEVEEKNQRVNRAQNKISCDIL